MCSAYPSQFTLFISGSDVEALIAAPPTHKALPDDDNCADVGLLPYPDDADAGPFPKDTDSPESGLNCNTRSPAAPLVVELREALIVAVLFDVPDNKYAMLLFNHAVVHPSATCEFPDEVSATVKVSPPCMSPYTYVTNTSPACMLSVDDESIVDEGEELYPDVDDIYCILFHIPTVDGPICCCVKL